MKILKTTLGICAAITAKKALKAMDYSEDPFTAMVVGSLCGAAAYHLLKEDAKEVIDMIKGKDTDTKLLENS